MMQTRYLLITYRTASRCATVTGLLYINLDTKRDSIEVDIQLNLSTKIGIIFHTFLV